MKNNARTPYNIIIKINLGVIEMRVVIEVHLNIQGTRLLKAGDFNLRYNQNVPEFAYEWIRSIKKDTGYRPTLIEKVLVNGDDDITAQVREIENRPIPEINLPF
jgi:hypothetical protein